MVGCATGQASRPHHTRIPGMSIPLLAHTSCYSPATAAEPVNPCTLTAWAATVVSSPAPCHSLRRPRRRPPPWCSRHDMVNDVHPTTVVLLQPLVFLPQPPNVAPVLPHALASRGRLCYGRGFTVPILLPPLARPSLHSPTPPVILRRRQPQTAAEPVNPRAPLRVGIHCRVFPGSASSPS